MQFIKQPGYRHGGIDRDCVRQDCERESCYVVNDARCGKFALVFGDPSAGRYYVQVVDSDAELAEVLAIAESVKGRHNFDGVWHDELG
jgi:hypothetical protein